ncbi:MAG: hypothetical protein ACC645_05080 [Pirellulales bacterium]
MSGAIHFSHIDVRRMPGFPRGGLAVDGLVEGINVVYGPNASGKTTLARAMQRLLRPHAEGRPTDSLAAELVVAGRAFDLDYHLGQITCRSGGHEVPVPALAPAEVGQRYVLALHDLVQQEDDRDIVERIIQEAAGGYDVAAAAQGLGFNRDRPSGRNNRAVRDYDESVRDRKAAEDRLVGIDRDAQRLADLEQQRSEAYEAQLRQDLIGDALDALSKKDHLTHARAAVAAFPESMSNFVGDEWQRLTDLKKKLAGFREKLAQENRSLVEAERDIAATSLPQDGVSAELVLTLQGRCETLRDRAADISRLTCELAKVEKELGDALERLGPEVSPERAEVLKPAMLDKLFTFVRQAEEQRLEGEAAGRLANWLKVVPPVSESPDTLQEGMALLRQWLAEQRITRVPATAKREWLVAAGITAVVSAVMAFVHPSWLLLFVLAGGLASWAFLRPRLATTPAADQEIPAQWDGLGFSPPTDWTPVEVTAVLRRLQQEWAAAQLYQEKSQRFSELQGHLDKYQEQQRQVDKVRQVIRNRLGVEIDTDDARMYLLAADVHQAQVAQKRAAAAKAELAEAQEQHDETLAAINTDIAPYAAVLATDADQASALVRDLDQRRQDHRNAIGQRKLAEDDIRECNSQIEDLEAEKKGLFADLGMTHDDELTLRQWTDQFPQYQQACDDRRLAEHDASSAVATLDEHVELLQRSRDQLQTELDECRRLAQKLTELDERLGDIRGRVQRAKEETALETALAREEACLDALRTMHDNDAAQLVGNVLVSYLARQQRDVQQPGVLTRAAELFARITHGRHRLLVEPGDPPRFRALDTSLEREQNLDELSSGTRLQLLLSVRVAFVEQQEQGLQLPLIFDETLGNSDEQRAGKIIEAAVEIARSGRQVFYFTAQHDELGKWRRVLREIDDIAHCEFDLARLRGFSEVEHAPEVLDFEPPRSPPIPVPEQDDWIAYGRLLNVPPLDRRGQVGGIHLWYVVNDVHELHRLLTHDINKWGQLQTLVDIGSADGLDRESLVFRRASAAARLLEHLLRYWRQGRGEPVERVVLEASKAVSSTFIDKVSRLSQLHDGDARRLIENLRAGQVRRFHTAQIDALESYLVECGCLDDRPILDAAHIREAITPLVFADCETGLLSRERVDQLVALVTHERMQEP